jgi:galacturan 1,4-alpha-galacturonidase
MVLFSLLKALLLSVCVSSFQFSPASQISFAEPICTLTPSADGGDDAPAIVSAFEKCGQGGKIVFTNHTFHINSVMNTTGLNNVRIELNGTLKWSDNLTYWLSHSMLIGYQNQSTVWFLGGKNIGFDGFGIGTFDGNGQAWYEFVNGRSNYPRRPMGLTIWESQDSTFRRLRFVKSQMWTMTVMRSTKILLEDIYVNSTSSSRKPARNTDGANTLYVRDVTFRRWEVDNGDDAIALKANSSNVLIEDCVFHAGAIALGSIGQYMGRFEVIEDVVIRNVKHTGKFITFFPKTWTGKQKGYPPNGGGGGIGCKCSRRPVYS